MRVPGPTALGVVRDASTEVAGALRPLSVTDHFSFGLGVCGIGGFEAHGSSFWYLKLNHRGSQIGGDKLRLHGGDRVLWYLAPTFPPPPELLLTGAPARVRPGQPFTVRVFAYDDAGHKSPVGGAKVTGADLPTGADGRTEVALQRSAAIKNKLQATHGNDIPSNRIAVCVSRVLSRCPGRHHRQVVGSRGADAISGSKLIDKVRARAGADRVDLRGGGPDVVDCGTGRDIAVLDASDRAADNCERIERD